MLGARGHAGTSALAQRQRPSLQVLVSAAAQQCVLVGAILLFVLRCRCSVLTCARRRPQGSAVVCLRAFRLFLRERRCASALDCGPYVPAAPQSAALAMALALPPGTVVFGAAVRVWWRARVVPWRAVSAGAPRRSRPSTRAAPAAAWVARCSCAPTDARSVPRASSSPRRPSLRVRARTHSFFTLLRLDVMLAAASISYTPALPPATARALAAWVPGCASKAICVCAPREGLGIVSGAGANRGRARRYDHAFWRDPRPTGGPAPPHITAAGPAHNVFEIDVGGRPALVAVLTGAPGRAWAALPTDARAAALREQFGRMYGPAGCAPPTE